jgi:putative aldouronate transport system permease protein
LWRGLLVLTDIWESVGFGSILYLAAIANINTEMYEAAVIDGAGRLKQILYITLPSILPTIIVMFILSMGGMMNGNFQQIYSLVGVTVTEDPIGWDASAFLIGMMYIVIMVGVVMMLVGGGGRFKMPKP